MGWGVLRIALHEAQRYLRLLNRTTILAALVAGLVVGLAAPQILERGIHPDAGLYRVEINESSPLLPAVLSDPKFDVIVGIRGAFVHGDADLFILGEIVSYDPGDQRSRAAGYELEKTTRRWLDAALASEADGDAAFPVRVNIVYQARSLSAPPEAAPTTEETTPATTSTTAATDATPTQTTVPTSAAPLPDSLLVNQSDHRELALSPSEVNPPFPIRSLLLTFAYIVPLNLISQLYASSLLGERTRQRGVLLLSTPHTGPQILFGKTLPYLAASVAIALVTTLFIDATFVGLLAVLPILLFSIAAAALLGLLARSARELTFLLVTLTVLLSTFLFLPAIFTEIHPVAYLSPITVASATIRGDAVGLGAFLYATMPLALAGLVLGGLSLILYREEELFAPRTLLGKLSDGVGLLVAGKLRLLAAGALAVPFAIGLEIFLLVFAVTLNLETAFILFLVGSAFVEEALKALVSYSHMRHAKNGLQAPLPVGLLVGSGFFLGEKFALVFSLIGFGLLPQGPEALATFGIGPSLVLLLAPLALHTFTATVGALGSRRGARGTFLSWAAAGTLHAAYNGLLVLWLRGGLP